MSLPTPRPSPPAGDEGVRVIRKAGPRHGPRWLGVGSGLVAVIALAVGLRLSMPGAPAPGPVAASPATIGDAVPFRHAPALPDGGAVGAALPPSWEAAVLPPRLPAPSDDPDDLASYVRPGDPEPTMAEVIEALHGAGIRTGLGAFNPPGTSPALAGLAVPADFALPEGYVRHHQVTDDGEPIEAILMFAPDVVLRDAGGAVLPMPANRVVTPEFAPPGLPIRRVEPPGT